MVSGALYAAVKAVLDRAQTDPDLGYLLGPGGNVFRLLCEAEAEALGESIASVSARRGMDLQPPHAKRRPDVVAMRDLLSELDPDWRGKIR